MTLLAIDTATHVLGLALYDGHTLLGEQFWRTPNKHNMILGTAIQTMLDHCALSTEQLSALAVAQGPGSYTGLRIGIALAKGMANARHLPLIGVSTLDIIAAGQTFTHARQHLLAILQAGRGRIIVGEYQIKKGRWSASQAPILTHWDALFAQLQPEQTYYLAGEIDAEASQRIIEQPDEDLRLQLVDPARRARRTGFLAQEAWHRWQLGDPDQFDPAKLVPVYLNKLD